ncbi:MAG: gliding motility protein GldM, partial [Clostridiales bacterium]|nr:gliding motility protein GldM [Clostridiales bacterium]
RQKMISMMYLVLTALLALNVSKDILNAFVVVNDSIVETKRIFQAKVEGNYAMFDKAYAVTPEKVEENYNKAQKVKKAANELVAFIQETKYELIAVTEKMTIDEVKSLSKSCEEDGTSFLAQIKGKDRNSAPTHYFIGTTHDGGSSCKAYEMKEKIIAFKAEMIRLLGGSDSKFAKEVNLGLEVEKDFPNLDGDGTMNWQMTNFYGTILAADVVLLNKLELEVRNAEADVVALLYKAVNADDFTFDKIGAKVIPVSNYVLIGDDYEAEIFVAAYDSKQQPEIIVGSGVDSVTYEVFGTAKTIEGENGVGIYKVPASSMGEQKYGGVIKVKSSSGTTSYPFESTYFVAQPSATVSADKMNVFYIGVDNPVTVSVPGVPNDKVRPGISNGSMTPTGNGKYIVRVTGGATSTISVSAELESGSRSMGQSEFRVKPLPTPKAYVANKPGGNYSSSELIASPYVTAVMENFDFDLKFMVISYTFLAKNNAGDLIPRQGGGYMLNGEMKSLIQSSRRGSRFWVEDIIARGPAGNVSLGSVSIRITN